MIFTNIQADMGRPEPGMVILVNGRERIVRQISTSRFPDADRSRMQHTVIHFDNVDGAVYEDELLEPPPVLVRLERQPSHGKLNDLYHEWSED